MLHRKFMQKVWSFLKTPLFSIFDETFESVLIPDRANDVNAPWVARLLSRFFNTDPDQTWLQVILIGRILIVELYATAWRVHQKQSISLKNSWFYSYLGIFCQKLWYIELLVLLIGPSFLGFILRFLWACALFSVVQCDCFFSHIINVFDENQVSRRKVFCSFIFRWNQRGMYL